MGPKNGFVFLRSVVRSIGNRAELIAKSHNNTNLANINIQEACASAAGRN